MINYMGGFLVNVNEMIFCGSYPYSTDTVD